MIFSHHHPSEYAEKCWRFPIGQSGFHVCSRCLGLYPSILLTLGVVFSFGLVPGMPLAAVLFWVFITPGWIHWAREHMTGHAWGAKAVRTFAGAVSGVGAGIMLSSHFTNPWNQDFVLSTVLLAVFSGAVIFIERFWHGLD